MGMQTTHQPGIMPNRVPYGKFQPKRHQTQDRSFTPYLSVGSILLSVLIFLLRVLRPSGNPKKLKQEDIMRNLQQTVVLDSMATLDFQTGRNGKP